MSHFQIGLAVLGSIVLTGVIVWNLWQLQRNRPKRPLPQRPSPATGESSNNMQFPRREPELSAATDGPDAALSGDTLGLSIGPPETGGGLDPLIDAIVPLTPEPGLSAIPGSAVLAALPRSRRIGSKPFSFEGQNQITGLWECPQPGQYYRKFRAGVQLANRAGALNAREFSEFASKVQAFSEAIGVRPQFPDQDDQLERARSLDAFAAAHDQQMVFLVCARQTPWAANIIKLHAGWQGFIYRPQMPGQMLLPAVGEDYNATPTPLLLLIYADPATAASNDLEQTALSYFSLSFDVAHIPRDENVFERLASITRTLCQEMDGVLCDPDGNPLSEEDMQIIAESLETLYDIFEQHKLPAGAALTKRLFS